MGDGISMRVFYSAIEEIRVFQRFRLWVSQSFRFGVSAAKTVRLEMIPIVRGIIVITLV